MNEGGGESTTSVSGSNGTSQHQFAELGGAKTTCDDWNQWKGQAPFGIATLGMYQPSVAIQKKKSKRGALQLRATKHSCIACNTENGSTVCPDIRGGQILPTTSSVLDYEEVSIPEDSVIYCDIPYENTNVYNKAEGFDYERFYQWCERQTQPVFISSYQMPTDRFDCVEEFTHRSTLSATANNLVTERIYVPKHQKERGNRTVQLTLF